MATIRVGQTVETTSEQQGVVRYVGPIHVSDGTFVGIELPTPTGKNDGSVRGERYFTCPPGHGLFIRDSSIAAILSQPAPPPPSTPKAAAPKPKPPTTTPRARPSSVVASRPSAAAAARPPPAAKRQSVAAPPPPSTLRGPTRKASVASVASNTPTESSRTAPAPSRPSLTSSVSSNPAAKAARDANIETLQTKIRHLEKQHAEDQERLRELTQVKDERDRFNGIIQKIQAKCQSQYSEMQEMKDAMKTLQQDNEALTRAHQDHEVDLEDALVDKEMAEERADQAESELESLRKRVEEQSLELDILREEAELFTTEMSEEQKQEAGYYRLQHENDRLRNALITLKEMTEEREQDQKARIASLEADLTQLERLEQENTTLQERVTESDALVEHLKQQLDAANEWEDMVGELSHQNQNLQDRIAEQEMVVQDLENLRELNDELEVQHLEQEEEMLAEIEAKDSELAEQARVIAEQAAIIADNESLINKFRDLVMDLQTKMADAESSKNLTEAQVKDTTGRFNQVMDLNRQLRAATVLSTTREIEASLISLKADQLAEKLEIWNETESKEFTRSESLQAYLTAERIVGKSELLMNVLRSTNRQMSQGGRIDDALTRLACGQSISHLEIVKDGNSRLWSAIRSLTLAEFANIGPTYQELITVEQVLDQGLNALKADTVNFEDFAGSLQRSTKTQEAILSSHQDVLAERPEGELVSRITSIHARLDYIAYMYDLAAFTLQKLPENVLEECEYAPEHFKSPMETTQGALAAATKLLRTVENLAADNMYPRLPGGLDEAIRFDDVLAQAADGIAGFTRSLIEEVTKCVSLSDPESLSESDMAAIKASIDDLDSKQSSIFVTAGLNSLTSSLRHWTDHASVLSNNVEIEHGPTPWSQKAKEVEAARKKDDEAVRQLQVLTAEHRATVLKIHEREQVIATKELEIEHLSAKIRDAASKTEGVEALQEELAKCHDQIVQLQEENRAQALDLEALKERLANVDESKHHDAEPTTENNTAPVEQPQQAADPRSIPGGVKTFIDALQNENHWLRERENKESFDRNIREIFGTMEHARRDTTHKVSLAGLDVLELAWLTDDDAEDIDASSRTSSPAPSESNLTYHIPHAGRPKMTALELSHISLGWEERAHSHKVALEQAEEEFMFMSSIREDEDAAWN
ncbi:cap-gly domain-containing protein [Curvularia clavata]|uniref:Cap-gly domain-containing protein n=1 Tax=Curvularia clavata TaxID=95742 RepID=A0A9Q8ZFF4_CURCL|nr:cap-gly domain-containing protein [Curvularia clavata]